MASFAAVSSRGVALPCRKTSLIARKPRALVAAPRAVGALAELAETTTKSVSGDLANALSTLPVRDIGQFLLEHPVASFSISVAALFLVPKLIEAFIRYLAAPVAIALVAFYTLENPEDSATFVTTVLGWINNNPEITSVVVIGLALFGLAPALLTALGATALIYGLLSLSFGTQVPEVRQMQGEFQETVSRVQFLTSLATARVQQLLK